MTRTHSRFRPLLLAALVAAPGCSMWERLRLATEEPLPPPKTFRDESIDLGFVRRILVLPLVDESGQAGEGADAVTSALREELQLLGRFQIVVPRQTSDAQRSEEAPHRQGRVPVSALIELAREYGVDAVLFGSISLYRAYPPPALGLQVELVDVETGKVLWSANDVVDAADRRAATSLDRYFLDRAAEEETVMGSDVLRNSPARFARFVAHRVVQTLDAAR